MTQTESRTVRDVMTADVVTVTSRTPFKELARLMDEHRISALPVIDGARRVLGIVSEADLLLKQAGRRQKLGIRDAALLDPDQAARLAALVADDLMTAPAVTVGPDETVAGAARTMLQRGVKRLPVVDQERTLLGIVSRADVLRVFLADDAALEREVRAALARTIGAEAAADLTVALADGVATIGGVLGDSSRIPAVALAVSGVDGIVDVTFALEG
ncbi:CBS domain-containing protein [Streptacidiphilus neutrinimicus]|uniref:CBS domain-containing protein n=1 Tax=Streptacidiphilus neutrinimicus TaxID=105420 RepID=UPI0005A8B82C|nr:CBS domain-containing protein [Streptacidiphilus neutrinimicus]